MPNQYADGFNANALAAADCGNCAVETYSFVGKAAAIADKIYFGIIPAGVRVVDVSVVRNAGNASETLDLGFEPAESVGTPTAVLTQWFTALAVNAAGRNESASLPVKFDREVKLVGTVAGAAVPTAQNLTVIVKYEITGVR